MLDIDSVLDGKEGSPRLVDLLDAAEAAHKNGDQRGIDSRVVSHLETQTGRDGVERSSQQFQTCLRSWRKINVGSKRFG